MSLIKNVDHLYAHLPARMRRDDAGMFLKRLLTPVGTELDGFDLIVDTFHQRIDAATASQQFIDWWLYSLFGWSWFPTWFTVVRRRAFYPAITRHYARRGTLVGIKEFLAVFGLRVIVEAAPRVWGEQVWGESGWTVTGPLGIVVRVFPTAPAINADLEYWLDEGTWGESVGASPGENIQHADLDKLLRFVAPLGNIIMIEELQFARPQHGVTPGYGDGVYGETLPG